MIHQRASEGQKAAREKGVVFGAKHKLTKKDVESMANMIAMGTPKSEIAALYGIGRTSVFRYLKEYGYSSDGMLLKKGE